MPGKKRKPTHREVLKFWEEHIFMRDVCGSTQARESYFLVDSIIRPYAVREQQEADAKKMQEYPSEAPESTESDETDSNDSQVIENRERTPEVTIREVLHFANGVVSVVERDPFPGEELPA